MKTYENVQQLIEDYGDNFYQFGRSLYKNVSCGPWCRLVLENDDTIYYESEKANQKNIDGVIALEIGSIVEGSDVEIDAERLVFPFTNEELWELVEHIDEQAKFYWERDNLKDFYIELGDENYYVRTGFGLEFSDNTPQNVKNMVENFIDEFDDMEEGETIEFSDYKVTRMDKSDFIF